MSKNNIYNIIVKYEDQLSRFKEALSDIETILFNFNSHYNSTTYRDYEFRKNPFNMVSKYMFNSSVSDLYYIYGIINRFISGNEYTMVYPKSNKDNIIYLELVEIDDDHEMGIYNLNIQKSIVNYFSMNGKDATIEYLKMYINAAFYIIFNKRFTFLDYIQSKRKKINRELELLPEDSIIRKDISTNLLSNHSINREVEDLIENRKLKRRKIPRVNYSLPD